MGPLESGPSVAITAAGYAYPFWEGLYNNLWEAQGPANGSLIAPGLIERGVLGTGPTVGLDSKGDTYVYWEGANADLYESYWTGSAWTGALDKGMGPMS
jgi:hypothetical protein